MRAVLALEVSVGASAPPTVQRRSRADGRARRWDAGPAPTARDLAVLRFVGEQYAVRARRGHGAADPAVARRSEREPVSWAAAPSASSSGRWEQAGWAERRRLLGHTWVTLTRAGLRLAGLDYEVWSPALDRLDHHHAAARRAPAP